MVRPLIILLFGLAGCSQQNGAATNNPLGLKVDETSLVGACLTPEEQRMTPSQMPLETRRQKIGCIQAQAAQQIRGQLPKSVDPLTTLTDITSEGPILTYHHTVDVNLDEMPAGAVQQIETHVRTTVCNERNMRGTIEMGGGYAYRWADKAGRPIHAVRIDSCAGGAGRL